MTEGPKQLPLTDRECKRSAKVRSPVRTEYGYPAYCGTVRRKIRIRARSRHDRSLRPRACIVRKLPWTQPLKPLPLLFHAFQIGVQPATSNSRFTASGAPLSGNSSRHLQHLASVGNGRVRGLSSRQHFSRAAQTDRTLI